MNNNINGKFFSVGVGPGDPDLITIKAVETIKSSDIIIAPKSSMHNINVALVIASEYIKDKTIVECDMPMTRDKAVLNQSHDNATETIEAFLKQGKTVSFLTLGDPSIYSTAMYVHNRLTEKGYDTCLIPGVPSFCAVAASLNTSLCEGGQPLHIIPASYDDIDSSLILNGNKILMKSGKAISAVKDKLVETKTKAMMVSCASMADEKVYHSVEEIAEASLNKASYFSIILVKE